MQPKVKVRPALALTFFLALTYCLAAEGNDKIKFM
ncbi:hypothetical protein B23_1332 [Geobacillus thermoleovorans B23]|nr:hypothetical protein B23_1332 [Geobacillus thermoleovorans B23]